MSDLMHDGAFRLVWSDEFDGGAGSAPDQGSWRAETGGSGWGNRELQYYTDDAGNAACGMGGAAKSKQYAESGINNSLPAQAARGGE